MYKITPPTSPSLSRLNQNSTDSDPIKNTAPEPVTINAHNAIAHGFKLENPNGNHNHGSVLLFKQAHNSPFLQGYKRNPQVIESQQNILNDLLLFRPKHIFTEGLSHDRRHDETLSAQAVANMEDAQCLFGDYQPGQFLNGRQEEFIQTRGAGYVYFALNPEVIMNTTSSEEADDTFSKWLSNQDNRYMLHLATHENENPIVDLFNMDRIKTARGAMAEREKVAVSTMKKVLQETPQQVALIYGASHDFKPHLQGADFAPELYSKETIEERKTPKNSSETCIIS